MTEHTAANYYARRERQERGLAESATSAAARDIHARLAENYARLAVEGGSLSRPRLHLVQN